MRFALNNFKYGLPKNNNGIYNPLTRVPPYTFGDLLQRINEYVRVEYDEMATFVGAEGNKKGNCENEGGCFDKSKRKINEKSAKVSDDGLRNEYNFHKIMFDIQNNPFFEQPIPI